MKVLRQRGSGHLFAFCEQMAKRSDMEEVDWASASSAKDTAPVTPVVAVTPVVSAPPNPLDSLPIAEGLFGNALAAQMELALSTPATITKG